MRGGVAYWWSNGQDPGDQLSSDQSRAVQAGAQSMLNVGVDYTKGWSDVVDLRSVDDQGNINIGLQFDGHEGSDC